MATLSGDTAPEIKAMQIEHLRDMRAGQKLALVAEMNCTVETLALAGLRQRHPNDAPKQHRHPSRSRSTWHAPWLSPGSHSDHTSGPRLEGAPGRVDHSLFCIVTSFERTPRRA